MIYRCPLTFCQAQMDVPIKPSAPVYCQGTPTVDEETGVHRQGHRPAICDIISDGVATQQETKTTMAKEPTNTCGCYSVVDKDGVRTSCGKLVKGKYAPGHDAKLKGILIRAAVAGESLKLKGKPLGDKVVTKSAVEYAGELGWGDIIAKGIAVAQAKADKPKRAPAAKKAAASGVTKVDRQKLVDRAKGKPSPTPRKATAAKKAAAGKAGALV